MIKLADTWLEHWDQREAERHNERDHDHRVRRGEASDFQMSQDVLEDRVQAGDLGAVRAGLRARLSVLRRSLKHHNRTLVHLACNQLGCSEVAESHRQSSAYIKIVDALLRAGASANSVDDDGFSPLDLALPGASSEVQDALQKLGLLQRQGARKAAPKDATPPEAPPAPRMRSEAPPPPTSLPTPSFTESPVAAASPLGFRNLGLDVMTSGSEWRQGTFYGNRGGEEEEDPFGESTPGPLAQFLATGALLQSQGGWRKSPSSSSKLSNGGWRKSIDKT